MKKFKRFLLLVVLVIMSVYMSPSSQVFATEVASSAESFIHGSFDERTITISSSKEAKFQLRLVVNGKSTSESIKSDTLSIDSGETKTYSLESLIPSFSSSDITLNSVHITNVTDTDSVEAVLGIIIIPILICFYLIVLCLCL